MKHLYLLISFFLLSFYSKATTFIVAVLNNQFSPANIPNVVVGDVIQFNFAPGNFHNATSSPLGVVPAGAANIFSGAIGAVTTSYSYSVTKAGNYRYYCQQHSGDGLTGMVGTFTATDPIPVKLKSFDVLYNAGAVTAKWITASEQNVAYFSLQKSIDGKNYTEAGRIAAAGNSNTDKTYSCQDLQLDKSARFIYYMLKTVDIDGQYSFSEVKLIRNDKADRKLITQLSPNPVSREVGHLMFKFNSETKGTLKAVVSDAQGKVVMKLDLSANVGINNGHIHMGDLPAGIYSIAFNLGGMKETRKIMVQE